MASVGRQCRARGTTKNGCDQLKQAAWLGDRQMSHLFLESDLEGLDPGQMRPRKVVLTTDRLWALAASLPLICELLEISFLSSLFTFGSLVPSLFSRF